MTASAVFAYIDENQDLFIQRLKEVVAIKSVSAQAEFRGEVVRMGKWLETELLALGATVEMRNIGSQKLEGKLIDLPPVVLASYGNDPTKKTVLVYGHYDVQPALKEDGWKYDPFVLTEDNGRLFGRGSSDDKGPVICWLWVIQVYKNLNLDFPVNLKMCFEGMEESGSEGLDELVKAEAQNYFKNVDCICISDNYWLGTSKPCLTYGLRGVQTFQLAVTGPGRDLHSGVFGGQIHEPMTDLVHIMSKLVDTKGKILVPGIYDTVAPVTEAEQEIYKKIDFHMSDLHQAADAKNTIFETETESLMARWRFPTLSLHGIEGAYYAPGSKTVIPAKVIGKFSIRSVPNQEPGEITRLVKEYVAAEFAKLGSKNSFHIECDHEGKWWVSDPKNWNFVAATKAVQKVFNITPDFTREGGSIPVTLTFTEATGKDVLLLPVGRGDDGAHSINEKLDRSNYVQGIKLMATYLEEIAKADKENTIRGQ